MGTRAMELLVDFIRVANHIHWVYYDAIRGFGLVRQQAEAIQRRILEKAPPHATLAQLDAQDYIVSEGDPDDHDSWWLHKTSQGGLKKRNTEGGTNWQFVARMCLVAIYQFWEDHYRGEIARCCGLHQSQIESDLMGDLRRLRGSIIHNNGIAVRDVEKCKILRWFKPGDATYVTPAMYVEFVKEIRSMGYRMVFERERKRRTRKSE